MKKFIAFLILGIFIIGTCPAYSMEDTIIAVVNDNAITFKDYRDYLNTIYLQLKLGGMSEAEIEKIMEEMKTIGIEKLIEDKLIINKANDMGLEVRDELVDERINEMKKKHASEQAFLESLLNEGSTITDVRNEIRDQLKIKYIVDFSVRNKIVVNPQEVTEYYNKNLEKFKKPERVDLLSIFIPIEENIAAAKEKARQALKAIKEDGKDFKEAAKQFSEGPSIGIIEKGQMLPEIEEAVFKLNQEEISNILKTDNGFYIFKVKEKLLEELASLEEVKKNISNFLFEIKFRDKFKKWIEELKEDAFIEIKGQS